MDRISCARKVELLAPAGDLECLHAAVRAGADAVYLGLGEFNARRNAHNFDLSSFSEVCDWAHLRGVRIYVTLNIEILPSELDRALDFARQAFSAGADAFIVQDIGLACRLKEVLPDAALHISTQMNTHNAAGIEFAWMLGARRVTLARELSVPEVEELAATAASFGMEVETFAHGALCVCYSGQCLMSSMIGGRSANRGLCAQACRLPYELHNDEDESALPSDGEHLLSPRDLCTVDMLPQMVRAGVASLKIEGRMKSADYVYAVVSVYRRVLDAVLEAQQEGWQVADERLKASEEQHARLSEAFSRGFTTAYLTGDRGNEIMSYGRPNNRGVFVGRVAGVRDGLVDLASETDLHAGDVLEFWTNRGRFAETLDRECKAGSLLRMRVEERVGKGDRVFRVRNAEMAFDDSPLDPRITVSGEVVLKMGAPARVAFWLSADEEMRVQVKGDIVEPARTKPVCAQDVCNHVDRLGQTDFVLEALDVHVDDGVGIGFSQLHHLRADALDRLRAAILSSYESRSPSGFSDDSAGEAHVLVARDVEQPDGKSALPAEAPTVLRRKPACKVVVWATNPACARAAKKAGADAVYVPALNYRRGQSVLAGVRQDSPEQAGYPSKCVIAMPTIDHDPVGFAREVAVDFELWDYVKEGKTVFVDSMAAAVRALSLGARVEVGPHVPLTNEASLSLVSRMGVSRAWLSPELTLGQIDDLASRSDVPLGITVMGSQELMITEHCLLMSQGSCAQLCETCPRRGKAHRLTDRKGFDFPVVTDVLGRSHLYNGIELDLSASIPDLVSIGISALMVDTTLMDKRAASEAVARALRARDMAMSGQQGVAKKPNTTTGHLFRGVS